jgi:hypothetical protein
MFFRRVTHRIGRLQEPTHRGKTMAAKKRKGGAKKKAAKRAKKAKK